MTAARPRPGSRSDDRLGVPHRPHPRPVPRVPAGGPGTGSVALVPAATPAAGWLRRRRDALADAWRTAGPFAVPLLALGAMQWLGTLASPALYDRLPLLLAFLSPRAPFLVYASIETPLVLFVVVAAIRSLLADPINYCLGRRLGPALFERIEARGGRARRLARISERVIDRCGVVAVGCRPNGAMLALAGARRLNPVATGVAAVIGTTTYVTALALTADAAADPFGRLVDGVVGAARSAWQEAAAPGPAVPLGATAVLLATSALLWWLRSRRQPVLAPAAAHTGNQR